MRATLRLTNASPAHRIFACLVFAIALAAFVRGFFRPDTFGQFGHYRGGALAEIAGAAIVTLGKEACRSCHEAIYAVHEKDVHVGVQCEDCHGPGDAHVRHHQAKDPGISAAPAAMPKEYTLEGCLFCHRKLAARPRTFAQIDPAEHYAFLHVSSPTTRCIECHSPHEPLFLRERIESARIHPVIYECGHCHDARPERDYREVADHPVIFACRDCHANVVEDFAKRAHASLRCTACHLFHRENETSGRIFKITDSRFCLLCHELKSFKETAALPRIVYPDHLAAMARVTRRIPEDVLKDPAACLICHLDHIHDGALLKREEARGR